MANTQIQRSEDATQALALLLSALKHKAGKLIKKVSNPFSIVVIVAIATSMICLSLFRDNKMKFQEVIIGPPIEAAKKVKKKTKEVAQKVENKDATNSSPPTLSTMGIEPLPPTKSAVTDIKPATKAEIDNVPPSVQQAFIDNFSNLAVSEMDRTGVPASITMAQAIIESRFGKSSLAMGTKNHFGIKCFLKSCKPGHCVNKFDDTHKDFFIVYKNAGESFKDHSDFLMKHAYRALLKYGKDYKSWANGLQSYGYATDSEYGKKLIAVIERYELHRLDSL
jgi:flagellum-specific peptidoglycan hydrolase FlgJ